MDVEKLFRGAEKGVYELQHGVAKGPFLKALCKELRRLIPDDQFIELDLEGGGTTEVNGIDIGVYLLTLLKDIPDSFPISDPRPYIGDPGYNDDTWNTDLSSIGI